MSSAWLLRMAHPILNRICPIVLVTGCHTRNTKLADFLLPAFCTQSICAQAFPVLATWLQSQHECGVFCQLMTIASGVKEENVLIPVDSGSGHPWLYYFFLRCGVGAGGPRLDVFQGKEEELLRKRKQAVLRKGWAPAKPRNVTLTVPQREGSETAS